MSKQEKTKWIIGLIITICIAVVGWMFGGMQTVNAQTHEQLISKDLMFEKYVNQFVSDIAEIKTDLRYIKDYLKSIGAN